MSQVSVRTRVAAPFGIDTIVLPRNTRGGRRYKTDNMSVSARRELVEKVI
jgi:hypothetical protein